VAFSESFLQELCERNDIVDVVSGYVRLTKKSGSNQFGLCPFHSEKTPSFSVSADKQIFHCFGCGKGGGVINFIMEIENLSFPEAVEFLAKRANMPMPEQENSAESRRRGRMLALNRDAARYFYSQLASPEGGAAREYMKKRQISAASAKKFGLGFAPDGWEGLRDAMRGLGYTDLELFDAGLARKGKSGGFYDTFRSRLMFPVIDVRGNVIGFSGRILDDGEPKYMNSPETIVFSKSHNLFGLNLAKKSKCGYIILCEGNIDVVSMHQAGFDSAVASLGTSLTSEQARLISRYKNEIVIAYDNDGAGQKASQRAIGILEKLDMKVRVLRMTGAKDPDEFIKANGPDAFRNLLDKSENQIDYRLKSVTDKYDLKADDQKVAFLKEATDLVARLPGSVERQVYAMRVSAMTGVTADAIRDEAERRRKRLLARARSGTEKTMHPEKDFQPENKALRYDDPESAAAEEGVIRLLYLDAGLFRGGGRPSPEDFSSPALAKIYAVLLKRSDGGESLGMASLGDALSPEETGLLAGLLQKPEVLSNGPRALRDYIEIIYQRKKLRGGDMDLRDIAKYYKEKKGYGG
jgi:DNA primase